jgi:NADH-quinone oxidoreductase subunit J
MPPADLLGATIPDALTFSIAAIICVAGAAGVVLMRHTVHAALSLVATLFGIAVLFVEQDAQFLAAVQVIVYAGAIVVLFLFVIMLLGVDRKESIFADRLKGQRIVGAVLGLLVLVEVLLLGRGKWATGAHSVSGKLNGPFQNVNDLGHSIFTTYLLPFEVTSALLVIAVVGAVVLARRPGGSLLVDDELTSPPGPEPARGPWSEPGGDSDTGTHGGAGADGGAGAGSDAGADGDGGAGPDPAEDPDGERQPAGAGEGERP